MSVREPWRQSSRRDVRRLIKTLSHSNPVKREDAAAALGEIGDANAIEPLIAAVKDGHPDVRKAAARALGQLGDVRAVKSLVVTATGSVSLTQVGAATDALTQMGQVAVPPLIEILQSGGGETRETAAWVLGLIGDSRAVEPLVETLETGWVELRWKAANALGRIGDARAVDSLARLLRDVNSMTGVTRTKISKVCNEAAQSLATIGDQRAVERPDGPFLRQGKAILEWEVLLPGPRRMLAQANGELEGER